MTAGNTSLKVVPPERIREVWPLIRERIGALAVDAAEPWMAEDVFADLVGARSFLWATEGCGGFIIVSAWTAPYARDLHVWIACNDMMDNAATRRHPRRGRMGAFQYYNDTYLRPALFGSNYDFSTETPTETSLRVADRAGFLGPMSPIVNAFKGIKYQRDLAESMSGPVIGSALNAAQKIATPLVGNNSPETNTAERNAAAALYDTVLEPAIDATGAKYLKGVARSGVVLGTGNRRGGVLPGDKDAFTDAVGGLEE